MLCFHRMSAGEGDASGRWRPVSSPLPLRSEAHFPTHPVFRAALSATLVTLHLHITQENPSGLSRCSSLCDRSFIWISELHHYIYSDFPSLLYIRWGNHWLCHVQLCNCYKTPSTWVYIIILERGIKVREHVLNICPTPPHLLRGGVRCFTVGHRCQLVSEVKKG